MAVLVLKIMDALMPWIKRRKISISKEKAAALIPQQMPKIAMPIMRMRRRLVMSAMRPKGTEKAATAKAYTVTSQPTRDALTPKSAAMEGTERFRELPEKDVAKAVSITTITTDLRFP